MLAGVGFTVLGRRAWTGLIALALTIGCCALAAPVAHAAGCTNSWNNASGGSWYTASDWSKGTVPAAGEEACITLNGTYTVTQTQGEAVSLKSLTVGGTSGTQTLEVNGKCGANAVLSTSAGLSTDSDGAISLSSVSCGASVTLSGPIGNAGTITSAVGDGEGTRRISGGVTNTGALVVQYNLSLEGSKASFANEGAIKLSEGKRLTLEAEGSLTNGAGGSIAAVGNGYVAVEPHTSFTQGAGTITGTQPVLIREGSLSYTGSGAGPITVRDTTSLAGNIASGQTLVLQGVCGENTKAEAASGFTNSGSIELLASSCGAYEELETQAGSLTNKGSIATEAGDKEGSRYLIGSLVNKGTLAIEYPTTFEGTSAHEGKEATLTNEGTLDLDAVTLKVAQHNSAVNGSGEIAGGASGQLAVEPHSSFTQGAGSITGTQAVLIREGSLSYTGSGAGSITVRDTTTETGDIASGQTLQLQGVCGENTHLEASGAWSSAGTIDLLASSCGANVVLETASGALTSTGSILSQAGDKEGSRYLAGNLVNKGTLAIEYPTTFEGTSALSGKESTLTDEGTLEVDGVTLKVAQYNAFLNALGTIAASGNGVVQVEPHSSFTEGAATTSGALPVLLREAALHYTGTGASLITVRDAGTVSGDIAAGQTLQLQGVCGENTHLTAAESWSSAGTIDLLASSCGAYVLLETASGTLTSTGSIVSQAGDKEGSRYLAGSLVNKGTLAIEYPTTYEGASALSGKEATLTQEGNLNLENAKLSVPADNSLANLGGTIAATGSGLLEQQSGSFDQGLGKTSGAKPVILNNDAVTYSGKGASTLDLRGTSSSLKGEVAKGQVLLLTSVCGENTSVSAGTFKNAGTIHILAESCGGYQELALGAGTLENDGKLYVEAGSGGEHAVEGSLLNEKSLYLLDATLKVQGAGDFTQGKKGTFETLISSNGEYGVLSAAATVALGGKLAVKQGKKYVPGKGQSYEIVKSSSSAASGEFSKVTGNKVKKTTLLYVPHYSAKGVTLIVEE